MSRPLAVYPYTDPLGELIFEKYRFHDAKRGKTFAYRSQSPESGAWEWQKPPDAGRYLYRLPALVAALRRGEPVAWTEGEKDADTLAAHGLVATSHHGAAGNATVQQAEWFRGCTGQVFLLLDNDPPGAACVLGRLRLLTNVGVRPAQIALLHSPRKGCNDVTDHVTAGHGLDEFVAADVAALLAEAIKCTPSNRRRYGYAVTA